jgi:hypothetical protein
MVMVHCAPRLRLLWNETSSVVDDRQTNSVLFHLSVWPSNGVPHRAVDSVRVVDRQTIFCSFSLICLAVAGRQTANHIEPVDSRRVDDGQTNFVLFHLSVWPSNVDIEPADMDGGPTGSTLRCAIQRGYRQSRAYILQ